MTKLTYDEYQAGAGTTYATIFFKHDLSGRVYGCVFGTNYVNDRILEIWAPDRACAENIVKQFCADRGLTMVDIEYRITTL